MKAKILLFSISLFSVFISGCQDSQCFNGNMTYFILTNEGLVSNSIKLNLKDTIPVGSVLAVRFETPMGQQVIEHVVSKEDLQKKELMFYSDKLDNWNKWYYKIWVDVYSDTTKQAKIETLEVSTVLRPNLRREIQKAKNMRVSKDMVTFDYMDEKWFRAYEGGDLKNYIIEYVLKNETVEDWSELITYQVAYDFSGAIKLKDFTNAIRDQFTLTECDNFVWNIIIDTPEKIIYEWQHDGCGIWPKQHEISVVVIGSEGIDSIRYTKKGVIEPQKRIQIIDSMKRSQVL